MMSTDKAAAEIVKAISSLPTLPYFYDGDDGLWYFVYLGGNKRKAAEKLHYSYVHKHMSFTLGSLYEHRPLSTDGAALAARTFKKLTASCDSRQAGIYTPQEQEEYLKALGESELGQIAEQVEMYKFCREICNDYYRNRTQQAKKASE